jgi:hypothetical protein
VPDQSTSARIRLATAAWAWTCCHLDDFAVPVDAGDPLLVRQLKPLSELALAAEIALRCSRLNGDLNPSPEHIAAFCWGELKSGSALAGVLLRYPDLFAAVSTYTSLRRFGYTCADIESVIRHLARTRGVQALEFPPWRELDIVSAAGVLGLEWPTYKGELFNRTWLHAEPEPWLIAESSAYSLTHSVFYMTDFGMMPSGLPQRTRDYLKMWVPVWCELYTTIGNYDLLAEMLMVASCVPDLEEELEEYLIALAGAQRADGSVPGPVAAPAESSLSEKQLKMARFWADYHTTLVSFLAGIMFGN